MPLQSHCEDIVLRLHHTTCPLPCPQIYFAGCATKFGKQSSSVLECLFVACSVKLSSKHISTAPTIPSYSLLHSRGTYAGARVVFKNVDLHTLHWISLACSLTFSCDLATPLSSLSLRARFEAAFAPWFTVSLILVSGEGVGTDVSAAHICCSFEEGGCWLSRQEACGVVKSLCRNCTEGYCLRMWRGLALIEEKILTTKPIRSRSSNQNSHGRLRIMGSALSLFGVVHLLIDETRILFTCRDFLTPLETRQQRYLLRNL